MKQCIRDAYNYYRNPLYKECEQEFKNLPLLFGRKNKVAAIREKYAKKGLKVVRYEDLIPGSDLPGSFGGYYGCVYRTSYGPPYSYICGIDGSPADEQCELKSYNVGGCPKLKNFLWGDLFD